VASGGAKDALPDDLVAYLTGGQLIVAATVDADGNPYTMCMNSAVAVDAHTIRFALDRRTHSLKNIEATGRIMLEVIGDGMAYGVRGAARVARETMAHAPIASAMIEVSVEAVKRDLPPGVEVDAPRFRWGALGAYMTKVEPAMFEELRAG
jgi:predicted pyridoxine 5'-phosphate oxidase superfamily flavin-nucleotide-binding protein